MADVRIKPWHISLDGPVSEYSESLFAVGNGCLGMRGFSLQTPKRRPYDHAVFRAGFFEPIRPGVTDMVQLPDALGLRVVGEEPEQVSQELDLRTGVFTQRWRGRTVAVETQRMASMADRQLLCVRLTLTALADTQVRVQSAMDAQVCNLPVHDDQMVEETQTVRLLEPVRQNGREMVMRAVHTGRELRILCDGPEEMNAGLRAGERITVEKRVRVLLDAEAANPDVPDPWGENAAAWEALWRDCDIRLDADERIQGALRYNVFQMLCANAPDDPAVSIGARGLTHGRYKGNVFWDTDVFLLPFFCWQRPEAARSLVRYRLDRLDAARALARRQNLCGRALSVDERRGRERAVRKLGYRPVRNAHHRRCGLRGGPLPRDYRRRHAGRGAVAAVSGNGALLAQPLYLGAGQGPVFQLLCKRSGRILRRSGQQHLYQLPGAA